jgi:hypothetical protein
MTTATPAPESLAAQFTGTLWAAIRSGDGPRPTHHELRHYPGAFDPAWLAALPLPTIETRPPAQQVALVRYREYDRYINADALKQAHRARPRTRSFENVQRNSDWLFLVSRHLTRLSHSERDVIAALYESDTDDETLGPHWDMWYSAIVHVQGAKQWHIGPGAMDGTGPTRQLATNAGDILLIPQELAHAVATPPEPGHSRHLQFALCRSEPDNLAEATLLP